jgi:hypothetical protein
MNGPKCSLCGQASTTIHACVVHARPTVTAGLTGQNDPEIAGRSPPRPPSPLAALAWKRNT